MTRWDREWLWTRGKRWPPPGWYQPVPPFKIHEERYSLVDSTGVPVASGSDKLAEYKLHHESNAMGKLSIKQLCGGAGMVLSDFMAETPPATLANLNINVALVMCKGVVEQRCLDAAAELVFHPLIQAYGAYVVASGPYEKAADKDAWCEGIDEAVEAVFAPYEKNVTASWFGVAVTDTRLHVPVPDGGEEETVLLAKSFAKDVWRVLTNYMEDDELKVMTTAEILEAAGVARTDVAALLEQAQPMPNPPPTKEVFIMPTIEETLAKVKDYVDMTGMDEGAVIKLFDNALDEDDGIAMSGLSQLGGEAEDLEAIRMWQMMAGGEPADMARALYSEMVGAVQTQGAGTSPAAAPSVTPPPPGPVPGANNAPRQRKKKANEPVEGALPSDFFVKLRQFIKVKDEDLAAQIGVSRQTFINYGKENAKVQFVPDDAQRAALAKMIDDALGGLTAARDMLTTL